MRYHFNNFENLFGPWPTIVLPALGTRQGTLAQLTASNKKEDRSKNDDTVKDGNIFGIILELSNTWLLGKLSSKQHFNCKRLS